MEEWVHSFGAGGAKDDPRAAELLGEKGANLAELSRLGLPVPPGFTVTTAACNWAAANGGALPPGLEGEIGQALERMAAPTGRRFGSAQRPLLLAIRPGTRKAMAGLGAALLDLGLNEEVAAGLAAREGGDPRSAWDRFCRFVQAYGEAVLDMDTEGFGDIVEAELARLGREREADLSAGELRHVAELFRSHVEAETGAPFPADPREQLRGALCAAFASWRGARAAAFRSLHDIPEDWGLAVTVQAMVGAGAAAGVVSTRDPASGEKTLHGEHLAKLRDAAKGGPAAEPPLEEGQPERLAALREAASRLERHFREAQAFAFAVERGKLWILRSRAAPLAAGAALRVAVEMAQEGLIERTQAVLRVDPATLDQLLHPAIDPGARRAVVATGLPASPGAAAGAIVFSAQAAEEAKARGRKVILVRTETSPEDVHGMHAAEGVLTARGGMTSHAAVIARGMGRPCVCGAGGVRVDARAGTMTAGARTFRAGDPITIDGSTGEVLEGAVAMRSPELSAEFATLMAWADEHRRLAVRANAETPLDARTARHFGAEGIGLCRTEHMFFEASRLAAVREMILADTAEGRRAALDRLLPMQRADFLQLFEIMAGLPVTIRLLDPPLHEFLPRSEEEAAEAARAMGVSADFLRERTEALREMNPMLGHRGCRLAISFPEIVEVQARAVFEAAALAGQATGRPVVPEIMVPLVGMKSEIDFVKARVDAAARKVAAERGAEMPFLVGTMIELPRAALRAGEIAETAEFFSFGTNDLTQTTFGISRDDAAGFLETYRRRGIVAQDPFRALDFDGVGELMRIAAERGRRARPALTLGICGEHGAEPAAIGFCEEIGLDYVSCSPFRVPVARLAAAQASLRRRGAPGR